MKKKGLDFLKSDLFIKVILPIVLLVILGTIGYFTFYNANKVISKNEIVKISEEFSII